ncbi:MAG: DUF6876 family protein [Bacteroidota bacterium]
MEITEIRESLQQFCGSETIYRNTLTQLLYTEGIMFIAEECRASWFITDALVICRKLIKQGEEFIVVKLQKVGTTGAIRYEDGNDRVLYVQKYSYMDFPLDCIRLYCTNNTLLLPSEY